jgi:hypothetical protein
VVASRLCAQISLKMISLLARLSVFEDQYTVKYRSKAKSEADRMIHIVISRMLCKVSYFAREIRVVASRLQITDYFRRCGIAVEVFNDNRRSLNNPRGWQCALAAENAGSLVPGVHLVTAEDPHSTFLSLDAV